MKTLLLFLALSSTLYSSEIYLPEGYNLSYFENPETEESDLPQMSLRRHHEAPPESGDLARALLDAGPSAVVAGCVNALSGDFFESEVDFVLAGAETLAVERSYSSSSKKWHYRHEPHLEVAPSAGGHHITALYEDDSGFALFYRQPIPRKGNIQSIHLAESVFKKGLTNCSSGEISGRTNWKNSKVLSVLSRNGKQVALSTGGGACRIFERYKKSDHSKKRNISFGKFKLVSEHRPNGNRLQFNYDLTHPLNITAEFFNTRPFVTSISALNSQLEPFSTITKELHNHKLIWKSNTAEVIYHLNKAEQITSAISSERPPVYYSYDIHQRLNRKVLLEGRSLAISYNQEGKVATLFAPVGNTQDLQVTHQFEYGPNWTNVKNALGITSLYTFDPKTKRLQSISKYSDTSMKALVETFFWTSETSSSPGHLLGRQLNYDGKEVFTKRFQYDKFGNIAQESLTGNLTGEGNQVYIKTYKTSCDGRNLLLEENDGRKWIRFEYFPNSERLAKRFTGTSDQIFKREFFTYDKNGAICKEILDDGTSLDENNLTGVKERHLKIITGKAAYPIGLPEVVEERYLDLASGSYPLLKKVIYDYSPQGKVTKETHVGSDNEVAYSIYRTFDAYGNLTSETDPFGNLTVYAYDSLGNLILEKNPLQEKRYTYDFSNRLIKEEENDLITLHTYDFLGQRTSTTAPSGAKIFFEYDFLGRLTKKTIDDSSETYTHDGMGNIVETIDPNGAVTKKLFTIRAKPYLITYPDGSQESKEYSLDGLLIKEVAKNGLVTVYTHDALGRVTHTKTLNKETTSIYSTFHLLKEIDEEGIETNYSYDSRGRLIKKQRGDKIITYTYDTLGNQITLLESDQLTEKLYDLKGRVIKETNQTSKEFVYDFLGNQIEVKIGDFLTKTTYTPHGKPETIQDGLGNKTHFTYDHLITTKVDPLGNKEVITTNTLEQIVQIEKFSPFGTLVQSEKRFYDRAHQHIRTETKILGRSSDEINTIEWHYDSLGNLILTIEAPGTAYEKRTEVHYNAFGQKEEEITPSGISLFYTYDIYGRLRELKSSDNSVNYTYTYDIKDRIIATSDGTRRTFDSQGRLITETLANGLTLNYTYDLLDNITSITLPDGSTIEYTYKGTQLKSVEKKGATSYSHIYQEYSLAGLPTKEILANNQGTLSRTYDLASHLIEIGAPYYSEKITYDAAGNPIEREIQDSKGALLSSYTYDSLNQITQEKGAFNHIYAFDSLFNRTQKNELFYTLNPLNQVENLGFNYDLSGNLIENQDSVFTYDALNRLTSVTTQGKTYTYTYDAFHRRLSKIQSGDLTLYLYQGDCEIGSVQDNSILELRILGHTPHSEIGAAVAIELQNKLYIPIHDSFGNVVSLLSDTQETVRYSAFGERDELIPTSPWLYSSKRLDPETGFYYFGRRYLEPELGRFITKDPLGYADGLNLYAYVHNRPLTHLDPDGQFAVLLVPIVLSMVAEYTVPIAAVALEEAGYIGAAAFLSGLVQGYNGSLLEESPIANLDANTTLAANLGKGVGVLLTCTSPRKATMNVASNIVSKEGTVAATTIVKKTAAKWSAEQSKRAAIQVEKSVAKESVAEAAKKASRHRFVPDPVASGAHTTFRRNPMNGSVSHYETFIPQTNPRNPNPWESLKRYDGQGKGHYNKFLDRSISSPHVHDPSFPGIIREPHGWEIPKY